MKKTNNLFFEIIGWYGTVAIILAYAMLSFGMMTSNSFIYQLLNFTGAIGIVMISLIKKAYQPAALNIIWAVIGLIALLKLII